MKLSLVYFFISIALIACSEEDTTIFAELSWLVQCPLRVNNCEEVERNISQFDGYEGEDERTVRASCSVTPIQEGNKAIQFRALNGNDFGFSLSNLIINSEGDIQNTATCEVKITENATYRGRCGSLEPSVEQPCQVQELQLEKNAAGRGVLSLRVECISISSQEDQIHFRRNIVDPNNHDQGAPIQIINCKGI